MKSISESIKEFKLNEGTMKDDLKVLKTIVSKMIKEEEIPYNKNADFKSFTAEALKRAKAEGADKVSGIDVMQAIDKVIK